MANKLFEGFFGGGFVCVEGESVLTPDGLQAGFLLGSGTCGETKSYAVFDVSPKSKYAAFSRFCTRAEKKALAKILYHYRAIKSVRSPAIGGDTCLLFVAR